jgi:hypothetical protein
MGRLARPPPGSVAVRKWPSVSKNTHALKVILSEAKDHVAIGKRAVAEAVGAKRPVAREYYVYIMASERQSSEWPPPSELSAAP